jgi:myosin-1
VRRAGYSYKRKYELFLKRFKCLCPSTWPTFTGEARQGVDLILTSLGLKQSEDYSLGM